jgi:hypothetical protein
LSVPRGTVKRMTTKFCPTCREERLVEQPPCIDGHADCPEWACVDCGTAIVFGWLEADAPVRQSAAHAAA